jgi:2-polyprenyl-3-methyl-5-hydroxy-6-metoxy-1,4-benzoquinol methylase
MKFLDRVLQRWRIAKAKPFIAPGSRVLDIGSAEGAIFEQLGPRLAGGLGIDPTLKAQRRAGPVHLVPGFFPKDMPSSEPFDAIVMLAVLEHFPEDQHTTLREGCVRFLKPGGHLIITVPSPMVDQILKVLKAVHLIDGMSLEEHHGYEVEQTAGIFSPPDFRLVQRSSFQLGLNNLFVFERRSKER